MRSEQEMYRLIMETAQNDAHIRAVYLNGSRANPNAPRDDFQDYDIVYVVTETAPFLENPNWIDVFGERIIMQQPDELDRRAGISTDFSHSYCWLMQFTDGNRIDLHIRTLDAALEECRAEKQTVILLDKDDALPKLPPPSDEDYRAKNPTQDEFFACCNEFWWVLPYAAKGLCRGELSYALEHRDLYIRPQLLKLLCWYAGALTDFSAVPGKCGKYLPRFLPQDIWQGYLDTYSPAQSAAVWETIFVAATLFQRVAAKLAASLGLYYSSYEGGRVLEYIKITPLK